MYALPGLFLCQSPAANSLVTVGDNGGFTPWRVFVLLRRFTDRTDQESFSMPVYRSKTSTAGRNMAGARSLLGAPGLKGDDF